jgi:hypothetical protein
MLKLPFFPSPLIFHRLCFTQNMVPMELCILKPNHSIPPLKLSSDQTAEMIKVSATDPTVRMQNIDKWRTKLDYSSNKKIAAWGLDILKDMMMLDGRVLQPPRSAFPSFVSFRLVRSLLVRES